jgi:putative protease
MARQKFRPTRLGGFSGAKAYIRNVEVLKKRRNAVRRIFCDVIKLDFELSPSSLLSL